MKKEIIRTGTFFMIIGILILIFLNIFLVFEVRQMKKDGEPLYERVIKRFADTHEYNVTTYNCVNYSEDLSFILENLGYETSQERRIPTENDTYHRRMNLILEIEPQTAEIIVNRKQKNLFVINPGDLIGGLR